MATKKYEVGGMTDTQTCGGPGKPKCRKKFKSKGKSKETKGSILGTLGAIAGGIGAYGAYKKLKKEQKGGITKYQGGGSTQSKKLADLRKEYGNVTMDDVRQRAKDVTNQLTHQAAKSSGNVKKLIKNKKGGVTKYQNGGGTPAMVEAMYKAKGEKVPTTKETLEYVKKKGSGYLAPTKGQAPKGWEDGKTAKRSTKRYQNGGTPMAPSMPSPKPKTYPTGNKGIKGAPRAHTGSKGNPGNEGYNRYTGPRNPSINAADYKAKVIERYGSEEAARAAKAIQQKGGTTKKMKTGGMVNPNAKMQADKTAGSKGVKSGVNPKAAASKVARGRSGGTSTAPKTATPRAKYGMSVKRK